jgi:hypothetical protein
MKTAWQAPLHAAVTFMSIEGIAAAALVAATATRVECARAATRRRGPDKFAALNRQ